MVTLDQGGRDPGVALALEVSEAVGEFVESIAVIGASDAREPGRSWRVVADDAPHIVLSSDGREHRVRVVGARRVFTDIDNSNRALTVVARLRPGSLPRLLGIPASELTDRAYELESVASLPVRAAITRLEDAVERRAHIQGMIEFLAALTKGAKPIDARVCAFTDMTRSLAPDIATIASNVGMSVRGLRKLVERDAGMSPKRLIRIRALHRALTHAFDAPGRSLARAAANAGYSDQSHFTRECTALLGEPPAAFARRRSS